MEAEARRRVMKIALIAMPVLLLVGIGFPFLMFHLVSPSPGRPLAVMDIRSGQSIEMPFISDGQVLRIFLDMQCESCSFPVTGTLTSSVGAKTLNEARISAGDSRDRAWGGHDRKLEQHLIGEVPVQPAGTRVALKGTLVVSPARGWTNAPIKDAPRTLVRVLRLTVAP